MLPAIILLIKFIVLAILFALSGNILRAQTGWDNNRFGKSFWIAADYFLGLFTYFICVRTLTLITQSFTISTYVTLVLLLAFIVVKGKSLTISLKDYSKFILAFIPILILQGTLIICYWLESNPVYGGAYAMVGSLHSPRYANIAHYILTTNSIPVLNQNYMQSVMAATPLIVGDNRIFVSLYIFLFMNIAFFWMFIYGFIRLFFVDKTPQLIATILVMCGGLAVSLRFYLLIDSGWPWFTSGYSDTIVSLASYIMVLMLVIDKGLTPGTNKKWLFVVLGINMASWFAMGIQNYALLFGIFVVYSAFTWYKKQFSKQIFVAFLSLFIITAATGALEGGMLTPAKLQSGAKIPGMISVDDKKHSALTLVPGLPYHIISSKDTLSRLNKMSSVDYYWRESEAWNQSSHPTLYKVYAAFAIPIFIIPFLVIFFVIKRLKKTSASEYLDKVIYSCVLTFFAGLAIAFPFALFYHKWELSRFMAPGYLLIAVLAGFTFYNLGDQIKPKYGKLVLAIITIFLCIGPFRGTYKTIKSDFVLKDYKKNFDFFYAPFTDYVLDDVK